MQRRKFLTAIGATVARGFSQVSSGASEDKRIKLRVRPANIQQQIPADFPGLGFEISSVAANGLLSPRNKHYIQLVRTISREGVIRVGGNTSDFASWGPGSSASTLPRGTVVNDASLKELGGFLQATGWKLIWGLNMGTGTPEMAAGEAKSVATLAGDRLLAFELGNEPDLFVLAGHRQPGFGYKQYLEEFSRFASVLRQRLPGAPLAGPDAAVSPEWVKSFAAAEGKQIKLLTEHYYREDQTSSLATTDTLLRLDDRFVDIVSQLRMISRSSGLPYRLVELNSFSGGGKAGVSDTFASALWGLDLMFTLAAAAGAGINWQTGLNHRGFVSYYSPIFQNERNEFFARPLYYAMLAFRKAVGGRMMAVEYDPQGMNLRAHGFRDASGKLWVAIINKDLHKAAGVEIQAEGIGHAAEVWPLYAPAFDSTTGVTFAGAEVTGAGTWAPSKIGKLSVTNNTLTAALPPATAVLIGLS